ncbi:MAG: DMT family transporter [Paludibacter sp.]|jgi:drug/metabolite transporter (DMT)-like permease|nr:DMT family transporter [Paludibacter sp.]
MNYIGEIAAIGVAVCWTLSALFFEKAGRQIGSLSVNIIRLVWAFVLLGITLLITGNQFIPTDASGYQWFWLGLSGFVGLFLGDLFLFKSYLIIGSRTSTLIMSAVPMLTATIGWFLLDEKLAPKSILAIVISITGIVIAIADKRLKINAPAKGLLLAFGGALGQAIGLILSKKGLGDYDAIAATQIRILFGLVSFIVLITLMRRWKSVFQALKNKKGVESVSIGAFFGPFVGITLSLFAIQHTQTGIASTFMALVPVLIIVPSAIMFKEKITPHHVIGAIISIIGVSLFFI